MRSRLIIRKQAYIALGQTSTKGEKAMAKQDTGNCQYKRKTLLLQTIHKECEGFQTYKKKLRLHIKSKPTLNNI